MPIKFYSQQPSFKSRRRQGGCVTASVLERASLYNQTERSPYILHTTGSASNYQFLLHTYVFTTRAYLMYAISSIVDALHTQLNLNVSLLDTFLAKVQIF